jgi:hypothetical protein
MDLTAVRNKLADSITLYTGLRADGQARDSVSPPCAVIIPGQPFINYGDTMDGAVTVNLLVLLLISDSAPLEKTQRALDAYLGVDTSPDVGSSVPEAIEEDNRLGGLIHYIQAVTADNYGRVDYGGVTYFGARIRCLIGGI